MRKYALTKLDKGDYICPSNDGTVLWRFLRYYEDGSLETTAGKHIVGWFWMAQSVAMPTDTDMIRIADGYSDFDQFNWREHASLLPTRHAAIAVMEQRDEMAPR